jgi:uncharacterized protein (TIGR02453 family)
LASAVPAQATAGWFTADTFRFLKELKKNNNREWFNANKSRYEEAVKEPALQFIRDAGPVLHKISNQIVADPRPVGGSLFRIYRDTRFSKDKTPYKTHIGMHFTHRESKGDAHAPGFYVHIEPGDSGVYAGVWQPEPPALKALRDAIAEKPHDWKRVRSAVSMWEEGAALKRPPVGYPADHPHIEDLKRKDFVAQRPVPDAEFTKPTLLSTFEKACRELAPVDKFIAKAIGATW